MHLTNFQIQVNSNQTDNTVIVKIDHCQN